MSKHPNFTGPLRIKLDVREEIDNPGSVGERPQIVTLGAVVDDRIVTTIAEGNGDKRDGEIIDHEGGGAINVARAAAMGNVDVRPHLLVGSDDLGEQLKQRVLRTFPQAELIAGYNSTRRSVIIQSDSTCYTTRPPLQLTHWPAGTITAMGAAAVTIVGPMAAADFDMVREALDAANRSVLLLSSDQLRHRTSAFRLMRRANRTVLNASEVGRLTNEGDIMDAINRCRDEGIEDLVVTHRHGVMAIRDDQWWSAPTIAVDRPAKTSGAGDVFVGTMVAAELSNFDLTQSLTLGQAAAARHVAGLPPLLLSELTHWVSVQTKTVDDDDAPSVPTDTAVDQGSLRRMVIATAAGVGLTVWYLIAR